MSSCSEHAIMYWNEPLSRRRLGVLGLCDNSLRELFNDGLYPQLLIQDVPLAYRPA